MAARPWNLEQIHVAMDAIRQLPNGDGLALEACLTAANFEKMTKLVDATIRKPMSSWKAYILQVVLTVGRTVRHWTKFLTGY